MIIEYIWIFLCIWILSFIASCVLTFFSRTPTTQKIFNAFFFLGIAVHELSHYLMCILTHVPVEKARILPDKDKDGGLKGFIKPAQSPNFLQSLLISFAPLFVGTYIIGLIIHYIASPDVNYTIAAILLYVAISILTQISPSGADFRYIFTSLKLFRKYAFIQTIILIIALAISYLIIIYYEIFMFDFLVVLSMLSMGFYYVVKYSGMGLAHMLNLINFNLKKIRYTKYKAMEKNRYKDKDVEFSPQAQW